LRKMEYLARFKKKVKLSSSTMGDLQLWLSFIESAQRGISINRVVFRKPTITTFSDASEAGVGGFCPKTGVMWRHRFTEEESKAFTLNCKEYIGSAIDMDLHMEIDPDPSQFPCVLNMTDSSTAMGWLRKSNHDPEDAPVHNEVARFHADNMMLRQACNYSQHLPGVKNVVADCCSRDFHLSDEELISMLTSLHPSLNPSQFRVIPLPQKYTSKVAAMARRWPGSKESPSRLIRSTLAAGISGWSSSTGSTTPSTPIWKTSLPLSDYASAVLSCTRYGEETSERKESWEERPDRPSTMWQRTLWRVAGSAPSSTPKGKSTFT
jgi:hypothetical protein